ncbi:hypothetical protein Q604_UNBC03798G0001, partial [human gut metagenome]
DLEIEDEGVRIETTVRTASMEGKRPAEAAGGTGSAWTVHPCCPEETRAGP